MADNHFQIVCDNLVQTADGRVAIVESMFSGSAELKTDRLEVLARIHPVKKQFFDGVLSGACASAEIPTDRGGRREAAFVPDIDIHVGGKGGAAKLSYSAIAGLAPTNVIGEVHARGFDANAQPLIRQMADRSFRLVFCSLPPRSHALGARFDMDHFGAALIKHCAADIAWDDRDVFTIGKSAGADAIREILGFLQTYGGPQGAAH